MRLDKFLSLMGYSRSEAKKLAAKGRVRVNDSIIRDASVHVAEQDAIFLDGMPLVAQTHQHLMVHKPAGVLTATEDARSQTVLDLIPEVRRRKELGPVGRLDKDVQGLVLLTTDGQLAHRLISPRWTVEKRYLARVEGRLTEKHIKSMAEGIVLKDFTARPAKLSILTSGDEFSLAELIVTEGKYHQVKRMFGALLHPVIELSRLSIGGVLLDPALAPGEHRPLTQDEQAKLYNLVDME